MAFNNIKIEKKFAPILLHTEFLGSVKGKVIHSSHKPCQDALLIDVDDRWYVKNFPKSEEYTHCVACFGENRKK